MKNSPGRMPRPHKDCGVYQSARSVAKDRNRSFIMNFEPRMRLRFLTSQAHESRPPDNGDRFASLREAPLSPASRRRCFRPQCDSAARDFEAECRLILETQLATARTEQIGAGALRVKSATVRLE
ncbi:MAG: hypothetical protein IT175_10670 [Acidobacteria bacterium]|nr:hypothetical protein [Acidobacteriota bacterium]